MMLKELSLHNKFVGRNAIIYYLALLKVINYIGLINVECMLKVVEMNNQIQIPVNKKKWKVLNQFNFAVHMIVI